MGKQASSNAEKRPLIANLVLAGVAIGLSYLAVSNAIDSGSLLEYAIAAILFGLGIKNLVQAYRIRGDQ